MLIEKRDKAIAVIFIFVILASLFSFSISFVEAELKDSADSLSNTLNNIPSSDEELKQKITEFIKNGWNNFASQNKYFGSFHNWSISHQETYKFLFNQQYSFAPVFFFVLVLWIFLIVNMTNMIYVEFRGMKGSVIIGLLISFFITVLISHTGILNWLSLKILGLIYLQQNLLYKVIGWIIVIAIALILDNLVRNYVKSRKESIKSRKIRDANNSSRENKKSGKKLSKRVEVLEKIEAKRAEKLMEENEGLTEEEADEIKEEVEEDLDNLDTKGGA
jgi:hypothetical protein